MKKIKTLIYLHNNTSCRRFYQIFNHDFNLTVAATRDEFLHKALYDDIDVGILCYCYAHEQDLNSALDLKVNANHLPIIIFSKIPNPDFISRGAKKGLDHFMLCHMPSEKIKSRIQTVIENDDLRVFIKNHINSNLHSPYTQKIITEILHQLPEQLKITDLAKTLGISSRWTQSLFKEIFGMTYTELMRRIHVYQALNLMKNTQLDNTEIALKLFYSDENSLYRIFQKELNYSPTTARKKLLENVPPQKMLH
jgi:AraC-like DNA-binding protein